MSGCIHNLPCEGRFFWFDGSYGRYQSDGMLSVPGDAVATWQDRTGNQHTVTQGATASQPTAQEGHLDFGADDYMQSESFSITSNEWTYAGYISLPRPGNLQRVFYRCSTLGGHHYLGVSTLNPDMVGVLYVNWPIITAVGVPRTDRLRFVVSQQSDGTARIVVNSSQVESDHVPNSTTITRFILFGNAFDAPNVFYNGTLHDFIGWSVAHDTQYIDQWLIGKYG